MQYIYDWVQNIAIYLVLMTAITQVIPNKEYEKYVKFYMGLVIVLMLSWPAIKILGIEKQMDVTYNAKQYRMEWEAILEESAVMGEVDLGEYISNTVHE